ncbi:F0F1 ATP synthase subunit A [Clostridium sp. 19966]|uniref:F0F1 ATP synthase subunit A n=1 Tax=Clostridium sp. 19966 TaxID=2768166 RepID=UPI0028DD994E|nr:F0F1 ATP synthase subunit A [Clostridium sp. 19966]MDT8715590.1 F0F1 ATP synthase subunit A [Clostridium sp. 19966]
MEKLQPLFTIHLGSLNVTITSSILVQWVIIVLLAILAKVLTTNLKKVPDKKQSAVEILIEMLQNFVKENMGEKYVSFIPYVGTLFIFILLMNLTALLGVTPPTKDLSVAGGLGLISFVIVQVNAIKKVGVKHYFLAYKEPVWPLIPINIIERLVLPVSLALRLFGNMVAGAVVIDMFYGLMGSLGLSWVPQLIIPIPLHGFFDVFDGGIQTLVFVMLTMMNIKIVAEH